jgi:hypothetical protein
VKAFSTVHGSIDVSSASAAASCFADPLGGLSATEWDELAGSRCYSSALWLRLCEASYLVVALAPGHVRGRYLGIYQLSWGLGRAVAPAPLSWLFAVSAGLPWMALAIVCATCSVTFSWLGRYLQPAQPERAASGRRERGR